MAGYKIVVIFKKVLKVYTQNPTKMGSWYRIGVLFPFGKVKEEDSGEIAEK